MFVDYRGSVFRLLMWQWRYVAFFASSAAFIAALYTLVPPARAYLSLPGLPLGVIGGAIGIFVSFRTNSAYDRWWEGRKLWGGLVNTSRHWASQVLVYLVDAPDRDTLVRRQVAYVHVLRALLRGHDVHTDADVKRFLAADELEGLRGSSNATHALLHRQMAALQDEVREGRLELLQLQLMDETLRALLDIQGGCERIKKTPFPRGYGFIAERLIVVFSLLFPLGIVADMGWLAIPMSVLVCTAFLLISEVGRVLEDPFTMNWPALPLSALSKTIEINLCERLGDEELAPMPVPNERGILM